MAIKEMFAVMEPAFVVILGLMVGGIAVSILLPIFRMGGNID
jgi:type II secretory pathway component PulF